MNEKDTEKINRIADFLNLKDNEKVIKTFSTLIDLENKHDESKDEMKNSHKQHIDEVLSIIQEDIANIPQAKDYEDKLSKIEAKLNEPNDIEVELNII